MVTVAHQLICKLCVVNPNRPNQVVKKFLYVFALVGAFRCAVNCFHGLLYGYW